MNEFGVGINHAINKNQIFSRLNCRLTSCVSRLNLLDTPRDKFHSNRKMSTTVSLKMFTCGYKKEKTEQTNRYPPPFVPMDA